MTGPREQHRFSVGAHVSLAPARGMARNEAAVYTVVAQLPSNGAHFQYRLRNAAELFERVAAENEIVLRRQA